MYHLLPLLLGHHLQIPRTADSLSLWNRLSCMMICHLYVLIHFHPSYALFNNISVQLPSGWRHAIERATRKDRQPFGSVMPDVDDSNGSRASSVCGAYRREQVSSSWMVSVLILLCVSSD